MSESAVIYARVSTLEQEDNYSLPTQLESGRKYAAAHGYTVAGEFTDAYTGTEMNRPQFTALKDFVRVHKVKLVIVHDIDRFSRVFKDRMILEAEIENLGAQVAYVIGNYDGTPEGNLSKHIKSAIAEYEVRQRSERVRRGRQGKLRAGFVMMSHLRTPYGYSYVSEPHKGMLVIEETEAEVVRQIYAWLLEGVSCHAVAKRLSERHIPTRGDQRTGVVKQAQYGAWSPATVTKMVRNPVYKGEWTYGKTKREKKNGKLRNVPTETAEQIVVETPAIVEAVTWEEAQRSLARNKLMAKRNTKHEYLLQGMILCTCGRRWQGVYKSHLGRGYYRCQKLELCKWLGSDCTMPGGVRQELLEEAVWEKVRGLLLDESYLRAELVQQRTTVSAELEGRRQRLEATRKALADVQRKIQILLNDLVDNGFSLHDVKPLKERLLAQRSELEADVVRLEAEIAQVELSPEREETMLAFARRVREGIEHLTGPERRRVLELLSVNVQVLDQEHFRVTALFPLTDGEISLPRPTRGPRGGARGADKDGTGRSVNTSSR